MLPVSLWLVLTEELHQQAMHFACISDELAPVVEALAVDADDLGAVVEKLDVGHGDW